MNSGRSSVGAKNCITRVKMVSAPKHHSHARSPTVVKNQIISATRGPPSRMVRAMVFSRSLINVLVVVLLNPKLHQII